MIDKKSGIAAYFKRGKRSAVLSNSESTESDSADKAKFLYEAWLFRDGEASQRPFPSPLMKVFETSLDGFLQKAKCVNPRSIGSTLFSECREWGGAAALTETRFRSLARVKDANAIHPTVQAEVIGKNYSVIFEWDFSDGLMPRMLSTFAKGNGRTVRNCNEIMRWGTIEGISVPVSVENDSIVGVYGTDGSEQVAEVQDDHKLYWLALNKNVQTDSLTESNIVSMKYVMEMTNLESYRSKCLTKSNAK